MVAIHNVGVGHEHTCVSVYNCLCMISTFFNSEWAGVTLFHQESDECSSPVMKELIHNDVFADINKSVSVVFVVC